MLMHQRNSSSISILQGRTMPSQKHQYLSLHQATLAPLEPLPELDDTKITKKESQDSIGEPSKPLLARYNPISSTLPPPQSPSNSVKSVAAKSSISKLNTVQVSKQKSNVLIKISSSHSTISISSKMVAPFCRITYGIIQNNNRGKAISQQNGLNVDPDVPNIARVTGANLFNFDVKFINCPPLPSYDDPNFNRFLQNKIDICSCILDFTNINGQTQEKEIKARALCELIELFEDTRRISQLNEEQQTMIFNMLDLNIFQQDCTIRSEILTYDKCNPLPIVEPCWPHLFYCYQILNRYIQIFPNSKHINMDLVGKAIKLTQLPDTNERMQLVAFLRTYFDTHKNDQKKILELVRKKLCDQICSTDTPFCAMPLIIFLTHIYSRLFPNNNSMPPLSSDFMKVMNEGVLPLIGLPDLPIFQQNLRQLLLTFLAGHNRFAEKFLRYFELKWPQTNSQTQIAFFGILTAIWERMDAKDFKPMSKRVFIFIADCVGSTNIKLQELALDIWRSASMDNWIGRNGRHAVNAMYEPVLKLTEKNWNKTIVEKASSALTEMCRINKREYQKMKSYINQMKVKRLKPRVPNDAQKGWAAIAKTAAELAQKSGKTPDFNLNAKLKEFYDLFHNEKKPTLVVSRFVPVLAKHKDDKNDKND